MTQYVQSDFFEKPETEIGLLNMRIAALEDALDTLRRSQFARLNALGKLIIDKNNERKHENAKSY